MLYNKEVKQIKDQIVKQIIGNYLKGAGENAAYLKDVKASNLGAVFLNYGEKIDLIEDVLVDYNKANPKMQSAGTLSLLIKETCDKIDTFAMKCETMEYPKDVVKKDLTKYANSLLDGVNIVAFSEGESDIDLKSDIKVLLREGREEFNKRIEEEEKEIEEAQAKATADPTSDGEVTEDTPEEDVEDDSDFIEEEDEATEEISDEDAEEEVEEDEDSDDDTDYDKLAQDEYGSDEEDKEDEDDIPTGESFGFSEGVISDKLKKVKSIIKSKTETMIQNWKEMNERIKIANEKAREPKGYPEQTPEQREAVRVKELAAFKAMLDEYVSSMEKWIYSSDRDTCWAAYMDLNKFFRETWSAPETALYYGGAYDDVHKYMDDIYGKLDDRFIKHMKDNFNEIVPPLEETSGESFSSYGEGLTDIANKFKAKIKATIEQSKKDKADKKVENFMKNIDSYVETMDEFIYGTDLESCIKAYDLTMDRIYSYIDNARMKQTYGDTYPKIEEALFTKGDELNEEFSKYTRDVFGIEEMESIDIKTPGETGTGESHMFKRKYGHTTIDPQAFSEMINTLLETERDTLKAFSESRGMSYIAESEDYVITSKTLINTTAVVLAARYKFGFYN